MLNKISKMSLGTVQLGMDYGINNSVGRPDEATAHELLKTALDGGVSVLDTASAYGGSEAVIGGFLKQCPQYKPIIVTKCMTCEGALRAQAENSLAKLGISKIPVLMLHREDDMFDYAVQGTLKRLKAEGLIGYAGVSLSGHTHIDYVAQSDLYEAVQLPLNMADCSAAQNGGLKKLQAAGKSVFVRSVFLQGLFFKDPDNLPAGILQKAAEPLRRISALSQETGLSVAELALPFVRDLEGVSSLILGCETPEQVRQNLKLMDAPELSEEIRIKIMNIFDGIDPRIAMPWTWNE